MWTHNQPHKPEEFTRESIEERGRLGLSRALNIGRVIGFVGSGATRAYGRPTWRELVDVAIEEVTKAERNEPFARNSTRRLLDQLTTIKAGPDKDTPARLLLALGTAEELAERLDVLARVREAIANEIGLPREKALETLKRHLGEGLKPKDVATTTGKPRETKEGEEIDTSTEGLWADGMKHTGLFPRAQPLEAMLRDTRVNRYLTLNYDLEIEREFHRWHRTTSIDGRKAGGMEDNRSDFDVLCDFGDPHENRIGPAQSTRLRDLPARVDHVDGTRRSVRSVTMNAGNVGDLVNFAMHPRSFEAQVFHLHGRCDKPDGLVLTEKDYQRIYLRSGEQQHTFDEALSAIFGGNEVLFVGVGMNEADMMRPLRQFVSQDRTPDVAKRPVYALMERKCRLPDNLDVRPKTGGGDHEHEFKKRVLQQCSRRSELLRDKSDEAASEIEVPKGATAKRDRIEENAQALELKSQFGVHVLYFGGQDVRNHRLAAQLIRRLAGDLKKASSDFKPDTAFVGAWRAVKDVIAPTGCADGEPGLIHSSEIGRWHDWIGALTTHIENGFAAQVAADIERLENFSYAYEEEIRARALEQEIRRLARDRDAWWKEWRKLPAQRRAEYGQRSWADAVRAHPNGAGVDTDGAVVRPYLYARHRPNYTNLSGRFERSPGVTSFKSVAALAKTAQQELPADPKDAGVRIVRCAIPRGGGKGALLHILQQFTTEPDAEPSPSDRPVLSEIFPMDEDRHRQAFCIHLSFSMEFASALEALRRFFKRALIDLMEEERAALATWYELGVDQNSHLYKQIKRYSNGMLAKADLQGADDDDDDDPPQLKPEFASPPRGWLRSRDRKAAARDINEFVNLAEPRDPQPNRQPQQHRVDRLRHFMELYRDLTAALGNRKSHRLFVCFAGLDVLCDSDGEARNPMFRAFFRLLSGCEPKRAGEHPKGMPLDLLLISGMPETPIRYLSVAEQKEELTPNIGTAVADREYRIAIDPNVALKKWRLIPSLELKERYWLVDQDSEGADTLVRRFMLKILSERGPSGRQADYGYLRSLVEDSVAHSTWLFGVARLLERKDAGVKDARNEAHKFLARVDAAAARSGGNGLMRALLSVYDEQIGQTSALKNSRKSEPAKGRRKAVKGVGPKLWREERIEIFGIPKNARGVRTGSPALIRLLDQIGPDLGEGQGAKDLDPIAEKEADKRDRNRHRQLTLLILQHLAAFPMPVESRVLYGCPEIKTILIGDLREAWRKVAREASDTFRKQTIGEAVRRKAEEFWSDSARKMRWRSREYAMNELDAALRSLHDTGLIMEIEPKPSTASGDGGTPASPVHARYTVHDRMRDFIAHHMRFSTPDRGDRNYFQVTLYCDQPRDLPTPSQEHYRMFRAILNEQISATQRTLWHFYQFHKLRALLTQKGKKLWDPIDLEIWEAFELSDPKKKRFEQGFRRRLATSHNDGENFDRDLVSVHAVSQRIRALYGLLRSSFSIGAISRLRRYQYDDAPEQPYESFRAWLRGLTNAAIAMSERQEDILAITGHHLNEFGRPEEDGEDHCRDKEGNDKRGAFYLAHGGKFLDRGKAPVTPPAMPLYRDEIGWLLNERGVISLVQGHLLDAIPLFERALAVMRHASSGHRDDPALHAASRRVRLNLAIAHIDRGNLFRARRMIEELRLPDGIAGNSGSTVGWIGEGYLGLIDHLSGHFASARKRYNDVIEAANSRQMLRLVSIFYRHSADLYRAMEQIPNATEHARLSVNAAMQAEQRDILHAARLSEVKARMTSPETVRDVDTAHVERARRFAEEMGAPRLETEALRVQADAMLKRGERVMAGQIAAKASAVAARTGLRLHKISALTTYTKALSERNQQSLSEEILQEARAEAHRLGYQTRAGELSDHLATSQ